MPLIEKAPTKFEIKTQGGKCVFFSPHNVINGTVELELEEPIKARGVFAVFSCVAHSSFSSNDESEMETVDIFNFRAPLWQPENGEEEGNILPGKYTFPYTFSFPDNITLPPSFSALSGEIRYTLEGKIDRPHKIDHRCCFPISYIPVLDCNDPAYAREVVEHQDKELGGLFTRAGQTISVNARIPSCCWCPGETIPVLLDVRNGTKSNIKDITCALRSTATLHAGISKDKNYCDWATVQLGRAITPNEDVREALFIYIPSVCPSMTKEVGRLAELDYEVAVTVHLPFGHFDMNLHLPVTIGTVPHRTLPRFEEDMPDPHSSPAFDWASVDGVAGMASVAIQPEAKPRDPEMYYMLFPMPNPSVPSAYHVNANNLDRKHQSPTFGAELSTPGRTDAAATPGDDAVATPGDDAVATPGDDATPEVPSSEPTPSLAGRSVASYENPPCVFSAGGTRPSIFAKEKELNPIQPQTC